jgi:cyclic beta-1,2-glucan synthetase
MSSTLEISDANIDKILFKEIETSFYLEEKEEKEAAFILGCMDENEIQNNYTGHFTIEQINKELERAKNCWEKKLNIIQVKTPDESFNYMINGWLLYQTISSRLYAKAGFYQVSGAYGFRDQLQDSMNICTVNPAIAREQIMTNAKHQFLQGDVLHWWHEETKTGLRSICKDDYLWLIYAVSEYLNITNDCQILYEEIEFVDGPLLEMNEKERSIQYSYTDEKKSLYSHCKLALNKSMSEIGANGLPLMGGGDWNDGMNKVGINGEGTSVWLGFFLYQMIEKFTKITKIYDSEVDTSIYRAFNRKLKDSLRNVAWDGKYYMRAFFDNGHKLGSNVNSEGSIDLISQSFAILTEIADSKQIESILESVEDKLVDKKLKIIKLLDPAFEKSEDDPGYIMSYPKGIRENGGQYTHAVSWYIMALLKLGMYNKAFEYYQMINPINRTLTPEDVTKYKTEPYVLAADIYSNKDYAGQGGWTWYTGSSGWFYKVGLVDMLGFHKQGSKLYIKPNVPSNWKNYDLIYRYEDTTYEIHINMKADKEGIELDGQKVANDFINLKNDKLIHSVMIKIGGRHD